MKDAFGKAGSIVGATDCATDLLHKTSLSASPENVISFYEVGNNTIVSRYLFKIEVRQSPWQEQFVHSFHCIHVNNYTNKYISISRSKKANHVGAHETQERSRYENKPRKHKLGKFATPKEELWWSFPWLILLLLSQKPRDPIEKHAREARLGYIAIDSVLETNQWLV